MAPSAALPSMNYHGFLPEGVHESTLESLSERFATNAQRRQLWEKFVRFVERVRTTGKFSHLYVDGGFITAKPAPQDIDVILQTRARYSPEAFAAMEPFFTEGLETIHRVYSVHLHFWCEGFPGGMNDFRTFFQYVRPQDAAPLGLRESVRKGIVRVTL